MNNRLLLVLAVVASLGIFFGYIGPTWSGEIASLRAAIASDNQALEAATSFDARVKKLASAREAIPPENIEKLERVLPDSIDTIGVIIDVNAQLVNSGLTVDSVVVDESESATSTASQSGIPVKAAGDKKMATVTVKAAGAYPALKEFLASIEKSQRLFDLSSLSITGSDTNVYTYEIMFTTYWLR